MDDAGLPPFVIARIATGRGAIAIVATVLVIVISYRGPPWRRRAATPWSQSVLPPR